MVAKNDVHIPTRRLIHPSLAVGAETFPMPDWASWLIWLGEWMKLQAQNEGRRVAVIRVPCRSTAAAFTVLGVLLAAALAFCVLPRRLNRLCESGANQAQENSGSRALIL